MQPSNVKYDTDKFQNKLIEEYESILSNFKNRKIFLLEIGIDKGGSLKYWSDYFIHPESKIIGIDIKIPRIQLPENVITYECNQNNNHLLKKIADEQGPFDIIIDDGSHQKKETENCFKILWDHVVSGGYYIIEDWAVGYWKEKKYKGMVDLITNIIKNVPKLKIRSNRIVLDKHKAIAFFRKGDIGWTN